MEVLPFAMTRESEIPKKLFVKLCEQGWFTNDNYEDKVSFWLFWISTVTPPTSSTTHLILFNFQTFAQINNKVKDLTISYAQLFENNGTMTTFSFSDAKAQMLFYDLIPAATTRKKLHLEAMNTLKEFFDDDLQSIFPLLAWHANKGGDEEAELFFLHKSCLDAVRLGQIEDAVLKLERAIEIAKRSKFKKFDKCSSNFTIAKQMSGWYLSLGECQYVLGRVKGSKDSLMSVCEHMEWKTCIDNSCVVEQNSKTILELLTKVIKSIGYTMSSLGDHSKLKLDRKNDVLSNQKFRCLGRLLIIAALELDQSRFNELGVVVLQELADLKTVQGNLCACFVSLLFLDQLEGGGMLSLTGKAMQIVEKAAMSAFDDPKMFPPITWAGANALCSIFFFGKDVERASKFANDAYEKCQHLSSSTGQLESLLCICCCEQASAPITSSSVERNAR